MKLVLVISSLAAGGAERVMSSMANHWVRKNWTVVLITLDDGSNPPFYELDERVRHRPLGLMKDSGSLFEATLQNLRRIFRLRQEIRRESPDRIVSFLESTNILTLMGTVGLPVPVVVSERVDVRRHRIGRIWPLLRMLVYPLANRIVLLSERSVQDFPAFIRKRCEVIPNPVAMPVITGTVPVPFERRFEIMAMGRLVDQKGFDILLDAFSRIHGQYPEWSLLIIGEGPLRGQLESRRRRLGLDSCVSFAGRIPGPERVLARAGLFVLPSRYEGFPNALCEAMALGLPVIAADCHTGPREIIRPEIDGVLIPVEDADALATAIDRLLSNPGLRKSLAANATEVTSRFSPDRVMAMWERVLREI